MTTDKQMRDIGIVMAFIYWLKDRGIFIDSVSTIPDLVVEFVNEYHSPVEE